MPSTTSKSFDSPDELRTPPKTQVAVVDLGGNKVARLTLQPGWRWSEVIKPIVGGDTCQARHVGAVISGTMHAVGADGVHAEFGPGTAYVIEPGHDAWVVGDTPVLAFEFESTTAGGYAVPTT
jgi:hypothetical protein